MNLARKIVLTSRGSHGDVLPFVALAKQLQALGHQPVLAACRSYEPLARAHGVAFAPVAPHLDQICQDLGMDRNEVARRAYRPVVGGKFVAQHHIYPYFDQICTDLADVCQGADMLLAQPTAYWSHLAAHRAGIPWLSVILQPSPLALHSAQDPAVVGKVPMRALAGLMGRRLYSGMLQHMKMAGRPLFKVLDDKARQWGAYDPHRHPLFDRCFSEHGSIALFPEQLMRRPLPEDLPGKPLDFAGFVRFDGDQRGLSADLQAFLDQGPPPLVFTLGASAAFKAADCYQRWSRQCEALGVRAVFLCADQELRGPCPPSQRVVPWVSVQALFARAAAVINAGGIGTCGQAAMAGVPQLIVPMAFDQPDNAFRMQRMGGSLVLPAHKAHGDTMARALKRLLHDELLRARAQQLQAQLGPRCGAEVAAGLIDARLRCERKQA